MRIGSVTLTEPDELFHVYVGNVVVAFLLKEEKIVITSHKYIEVLDLNSTNSSGEYHAHIKIRPFSKKGGEVNASVQNNGPKS